MKWSVIVFIFLYQWIRVSGDDDNFVYSYAMASQCKEHICQRGYSYDTFYSINAEDRRRAHDPTVVFEMHIAIQASSNGHILLSPVTFPTANQSVYEIVVGGGANRFTELRRNLKRNAKSSQATANILSAIELRGFYIRVKRSGLIEFGKEGSNSSIIGFFDIDPLDIKYFSFASWHGVEAKFLYDCPTPGEKSANQNLPESKTFERNLSSSEMLKREKLQDRPPNLAPDQNVFVSFGLLLNYVSFDAFESKLTTRMTILNSWKDESLAWNPEKFNNLTSITYRPGQIWRPVFQVYNSDSMDALATGGYEKITIISTGEASFHFKVSVDTWCYSEEFGQSKWPRDFYHCTLIFQPWEAHEKITLGIINDSTLLQHFIDSDLVVEDEWKIVDKDTLVITADIWDSIYPSNNNETHRSDRLVVTIKVERQASSYVLVFHTPLLVLMTFLLMSFWSEPLQMSRVWFYAGCAIVICTGLCYIEYLIPCHTIPGILVLYITVLSGILLALMLQVFLMTPIMERLSKTGPVERALSNALLRRVFCLPVVRVPRNYNMMVNEGYSRQEEDLSEEGVMVKNGNVEEMQSDDKKYCEREQIAEVLDKTMFVVYSVVFAVLLSLYF